MKVGLPFTINLACTGVIPSKSMNPYVPIDSNEIVEDVEKCLAMGVQIFHLHTRDVNGLHSSDPESYGRLIERIRSLPGGKEAILCVTTSGRNNFSFENRSRVLDLVGTMKPDMASLSLSSMNFMQSPSINSPDLIRSLAAKMQENGIRPELEVFDLGMANFINVLLHERLIQHPLYVNILLGNIFSAQADMLQLSVILAALPEGCFVSVAGIGKFQLIANGLGILMTDGVRVGLEDNIWFNQARTIHASNSSLVKRVINQAILFERPLLSRSELRIRLGMQPYAL